jgi:hypothetical protein
MPEGAGTDNLDIPSAYESLDTVGSKTNTLSEFFDTQERVFHSYSNCTEAQGTITEWIT